MLASCYELVLLQPLINTHHHLNCFKRIRTRGRFSAEHERICPIENGIGDITGLCSCWTGMRNHGLEHLRCGNDRQPPILARGDDAFLDERHFLWGHLHSQVSSSHHHAIDDVENLIEPGDRLWFLKLGNQGNAHLRLFSPLLRLQLLHESPGLYYILRSAHETERDITNALPHP